MNRKLLFLALAISALFIGPADAQFSFRLFVPVVAAPEVITCEGKGYAGQLQLRYTNSVTQIGGEVVVEEDSPYLLLCKKAYRPDWPVLDAQAWTAGTQHELFFLPVGHIVAMGPFETGQKLIIVTPPSEEVIP